jgi:hypothetical protein
MNTDETGLVGEWMAGKNPSASLLANPPIHSSNNPDIHWQKSVFICVHPWLNN